MVNKSFMPVELMVKSESFTADATIDVTFSDITTLTSGTWSSYVYIDENNLVSESNESNNSNGPAFVNWLPLPAIDDLTIHYIPQNDEIQLTWTYPMGVQRFIIYQDVSPSGTFSTVAGTSIDPSFSVPVNDFIYFYRVTAERM